MEMTSPLSLCWLRISLIIMIKTPIPMGMMTRYSRKSPSISTTRVEGMLTTRRKNSFKKTMRLMSFQKLRSRRTKMLMRKHTKYQERRNSKKYKINRILNLCKILVKTGSETK